MHWPILHCKILHRIFILLGNLLSKSVYQEHLNIIIEIRASRAKIDRIREELDSTETLSHSGDSRTYVGTALNGFKVLSEKDVKELSKNSSLIPNLPRVV